MGPFHTTKRKNGGYSLIEMLVVLAIIGVLGIVGVSMIGNRPSGAVRGILDELEGVLASAHKRAVATGQDVVITTTGDWAVPNVMTMTFTGAAGNEGFTLAFGSTGGVPDRILREHLHAGVVTAAQTGWWATAQGSTTDINSVHPFDTAGTGFHPATGSSILLDDTLNLFQGGTSVGTVRISGTNKRFTTTCWIKVVGITNGVPIPGGPMGAIVIQANGGTVYKFYNSGTRDGDGIWRKM